MKKISVLGSTGSIGKNTLEVISRHPDRFRVVALSARNSIDELASQIREFRPELVAVFDEEAARELKRKGLHVEILTGVQGAIAAATHSAADTVVSAIVGSAGLVPTYEAIKAGKNIALATKEALVMAGRIIMAEAAARGVSIIPVDSEHSAVFQCLDGRDMNEVEKIILTASGGSFRDKTAAELENVTLAEALNHPNWDMGRKITIDSATLMNKGLEIIEAYWLFNVTLQKIDVLIHPQSIIHSMVSFIDGSVISQMSVPDMKGPISYALSYPGRIGDILPPLDLAEIKELTFETPDLDKYPALRLTYEALEAGGTMPCVLNAANEAAVEAFLNQRISFTDIAGIVSETMSGHKVLRGDTIEEVVGVSDRARQKAEEIIKITSVK